MREQTPAATAGANGKPRWLGLEEDEPPARQPLSRRRIVLAALSLVEEHGLEGLTMRRVASALDVTPMSLYNHVSDKAELIDLMVDFILADVVTAARDAQGAWTDKVRVLARHTYDVWRAHPGFARVYMDGVTIGPNGLANIERMIGLLRDAGFSDQDAAHGFFLLYHYVISSMLVASARPASLQARDQRSDGTRESRLSLYFSALPEEDIPNVAAVAGNLAGADFEFGLDVLLAGLQTRLGNERRSPKKKS